MIRLLQSERRKEEKEGPMVLPKNKLQNIPLGEHKKREGCGWYLGKRGETKPNSISNICLPSAGVQRG